MSEQPNSNEVLIAVRFEILRISKVFLLGISPCDNVQRSLKNRVIISVQEDVLMPLGCCPDQYKFYPLARLNTLQGNRYD